MPEMPEVETVRRTLIPLVKGKTIAKIIIWYPKIIVNDPDEFVKKLTNKKILKTATLLRLRPNRRSHLRQLPNKFRPLASGVTNFHDVTGGVYKARERIHRSVADLRLLATPTSWGRVADPNPN